MLSEVDTFHLVTSFYASSNTCREDFSLRKTVSLKGGSYIKTLLNRKASAFLGAAAVLLAAVFMAGCNTNAGGGTTVVTYNAGDIVLSDKSVVEMKDYKEIDPANPPVGIICCYTGNSARMIALHSSDSSLKWAKTGTTGYSTKFEAIVCTPSTTIGQAASLATFTGDANGSNNWEYIKSIDIEGTADAVVAENYPAFNWVNGYNTKYADKLNNQKFDWYMPSLAELCGIYRNDTKINASLAKIRSLPNGTGYADEKLANKDYWSSSQAADTYNAWAGLLSYGSVKRYYKFDTCKVCCLAEF